MTENDFSQSELVTLNQCPQKWFWQYGKQLKRRGMFNWNFEIGTAFHTFLEVHYKKLDCKIQTIFNPEIGVDVLRTAQFEKQFEFWKVVFPVMTRSYLRKYPREDFEVHTVEEIHSRTFMDINFRGKFDVRGMHNRHQMVLDHKSTSSLEPQGDKLHHKFQFLFYFWLSEIPEGEFIVNYIKKPAQRMGKKETDLDFTIRVRDEIADNPDDYFAREIVYFTAEEMQKFEKYVMIPKVAKLKMLLAAKPENAFIWTDRTLESCYNYNTPCPFIPLCFEDEALATIEYEPKTSKHEELETE